MPKYDIVIMCGVNRNRRIKMDQLNYTAEIMHKQRLHEFMEEAKIDRFLQEKKDKDVTTWIQRRLRRNRKNH